MPGVGQSPGQNPQRRKSSVDEDARKKQMMQWMMENYAKKLFRNRGPQPGPNRPQFTNGAPKESPDFRYVAQGPSAPASYGSTNNPVPVNMDTVNWGGSPRGPLSLPDLLESMDRFRGRIEDTESQWWDG